METYINHITLNSGHVRKTKPNEIDKKLYFILKRLYKESFNKNGIEIFDGYRMKSIKDHTGVLITVYNSEGLPVITIAVSETDHDGKLWKLLHSSATSPLNTDINKRSELPYIADRLEVGSVISVDAMNWTGDFSRCMGWIVLYPNEIR